MECQNTDLIFNMTQEIAETVKDRIHSGLEEEHVSKNSQVTPHIQNISMKEVSDLMAQGEPVSFIIVSEGESALEWIQQTAMLVNGSTIIEDADKVHVLKNDDCQQSVLTVETKSISGELINSDPEFRAKGSKRSYSPTSQVPVTPKILKLSTEKSPNIIGRKEVPNNINSVLTVSEVQEFGHRKTLNSDCKVFDLGKTISDKTFFPQESQKVTTFQRDIIGDRSSVITIYTTPSSPPVLLPSGGASSSLNQTPLHQPFTLATESVSTTQYLTSAGSSVGHDPIKVSCPGAGLELITNCNNKPECKTAKELLVVSKVGKGNHHTGLVDSGMVYRCAECDYASSNKHYYKQHVDLVHNTARPFKCPFCDYAGKRGHALREHLIVHSAQRPYSCQHCNATFRKKGHLTNHTKLHATPAGQNHAGELTDGLPATRASDLIEKTSAGSNMGKLDEAVISVSQPSASTSSLLTGCLAAADASIQKAPASNKPWAKRGEFWCALCDKDMADAAFFQAHLQTVHGTDRLYACESCEFVTANKGAIMNHLSTHLAASTPATQTSQSFSSSSDTAASVTTANSLSTPVYACTHCGFTTSTMSVLIDHATSHSTASIASKIADTRPLRHLQSQQQQLSKVICSECGHVADNVEMMREHMWSHINQSSGETKSKPLPSSQQQQQLKLASSAIATNAPQGPLSNTSAGLKTLPENAAFKCTECSYVSRDASQFVKHMLVHKTRHKQPSKTQVQSSGAHQKSTGSAYSESANATAKASYKVKPVTTENTCQNTESSPFVHDASSGRFRCTICDYTCEYQRTIKAHIWKHSGHHQVDYPIFQNGPLSMYEDSVPVSQAAGQPKVSSLPRVPQGANPLSSPQTHSGAEAASQSSAVSAHSGSEVACTVLSASSSPMPLNVKFITVSGSRVLHLSGPLPSGNIKLVPVAPSAVSQAKFMSADTSKHLGLQIHSSQTESSSSGTKNVSKGEQSEVEKLLVKMPDKSFNKDAVASEADLKCMCTSLSLETSFKNNQNRAEITVDVIKTDVDVMSESYLNSSAVASIRVPVTTDTQAASAKCVLPISEADICKKEATETPQFNSETIIPLAEVPNHQLPALKNADLGSWDHPYKPGSDKGDDPYKPGSDKGDDPYKPGGDDKGDDPYKPGSDKGDDPYKPGSDDKGDEISEPVSGLLNTLSCPQMEIDSVGGAASPDSSPSCAEDRIAPCEVEISLDLKEIRHATDDEMDVSVAHGIQSCVSVAESNVLVETVETVPSHSILTSLHSQQSSPQVPRSCSCSPVTADNQELASPTRSENNSDKDQIETSLRDASVKQEDWDCESVKSAEVELGRGTASSETLQDCESAVTLLSLLKRGPNFNPLCPTRSEQVSDPGTNPEKESVPEFSAHSPSQSSESDSATKDTAEDLTLEMESSSTGKTGGGICSTLLAVIEQLRERSRSESDAEDKLTQPPAKKRAGRRRGRQGSQDDALELDDSENVEKLSGNDGPNYRCRLCHYMSPRISLIRLHMKTHRQKDPFECSLCPMKAESSEMLQEHMIQHCKVRTYACKFCPQSFNHKSTLRAHMRAHSNAEPFLCDLCEFESSSPLDYRAHVQKHAGNALLRCPHRPVLVVSRAHLAGSCSFTKEKEGIPGKGMYLGSIEGRCFGEKIMCSQCEFITTDIALMEDHMANHIIGSEIDGLMGEGPLRCALCDFTAVSSRSLKSHMKRHANDQRFVQQFLEQYKCALCGYVCHHLPSLKSHMWRHASDQNYSYQFTNDVINAAIDYDTHSDPPPQASKVVAKVRDEPDEPELLDRVLSAERRIVEGQMSKAGDSNPVCWVTFRCCQCGFESINKAKLNLHMRTHADIISRTLKVIPVIPGSSPEDETAPLAADVTNSEGMKIKIVYGPV